MHDFRFHSLFQRRGSPHPISENEYAVISSTSLYSIAVGAGEMGDDGKLNYAQEGVMRMVAGTAPHLTHVRMYGIGEGGSLEWLQFSRLGKPPWSGFFPGRPEADRPLVRGKLQSLVDPYYGLVHWAHITDYTHLRVLIMSWPRGHDKALSQITTSGIFKSLHTLGLEIEDESTESQQTLNGLLESVSPLQHLKLSGYISNESFDIILHCHGPTLNNLSLEAYRDHALQNPLINLTEINIQRLVEHCPKLEQVQLQINRTRGDDRETGCYRALSKSPRLKRVFLTLLYSVGPDEEYWDEDAYGIHPLDYISEAADIPAIHLREVFSNCATDANLARSIFDMISSGGSLKYLKLVPKRKVTHKSPAILSISEPQGLLRWLARPWVCKRDKSGRVTVEEFDKEVTMSGIWDWTYQLSDEKYVWRLEENFGEVFRDIWLVEKSAERWNDWESLPLSSGAA